MNMFQFAAMSIALIAGWAQLHHAHAADLQPYAKKAQLVQRLRAFDNPEGAIFSLDGKSVFVSNAAELGMPDKGFHWIEGAAYVSKLEVQANGTLKMINEKLVSGLTGALGMAVLPVDTTTFPRGTIFLCTAGAPLASSDGVEIKDPESSRPAIVAFSPEGKVLGTIKLGGGSAVAKAAGVAATLPNALAFDREGNLYLAETGIGGSQFDPPIATRGGGIYMFPLASLGALAAGREAAMSYLSVPNGGPDGIQVAPDGSIHFNTVGAGAGMKDPAEGGMYRIGRDAFASGMLPEPFARGLGALDGLDFAGTKRLDTEIKNGSGVTVTPKAGGPVYVLGYDQDLKLAGPADIAVRKMEDGSYLLLIPELSATSPNNKDNALTVVRLPPDF